MAERLIGTAKQDGSSVKIYDTNGSYITSVSGYLVGFTSTTVSVKDNPSSSTVRIYDNKGSYKTSV